MILDATFAVRLNNFSTSSELEQFYCGCMLAFTVMTLSALYFHLFWKYTRLERELERLREALKTLTLLFLLFGWWMLCIALMYISLSLPEIV